MTLPEDLPDDLFDKLSDTIRYYLRCSFEGVTDHPEVLKPEDWATGATLSVWNIIVRQVGGRL